MTNHRRRPGPGRLLILCAFLALTPPAPAVAACVGDCNGGGSVSVDEIVRGVNIALGSTSLTQCPAIDANGDGQVTVDEIISTVNRALLGCEAEPTPAVPTPTATATATPQAQPTPTSPVAPGCDNGPIVATLSAPAGTNAELSPASLDLVAAGTIRNPANGLYFWSITGNTCTTDAGLLRSVQIQIIGPRTGFAPGRYAITPPLSYLRYLQTPATGIPQPQIWDGAATTLVIDAVDGDTLSFHVEPTTMTPNLIVAGDPKPQGTFTLEVQGDVRGFTAQ
jgi:hypothetical protein